MSTPAALEVIVLSATTSETKASGKLRKVSFLLPNDEGEHPFSGMIGERLHIVCLKINDDETTVPVAQRIERPAPDREAAGSTPAGNAKRKWSDMPAASQIALACKNPLFREWLDRHAAEHIPDEETAQTVVKDILGLDRKRDLLPGTEAFSEWTRMQGEFDVWLRYERTS